MPVTTSVGDCCDCPGGSGGGRPADVLVGCCTPGETMPGRIVVTVLEGCADLPAGSAFEADHAETLPGGGSGGTTRLRYYAAIPNCGGHLHLIVDLCFSVPTRHNATVSVTTSATFGAGTTQRSGTVSLICGGGTPDYPPVDHVVQTSGSGCCLGFRNFHLAAG